MLQPAYHIELKNEASQNFSSCHLMIFADHISFCYVLLEVETQKLLCLKYFDLDEVKNRDYEGLLREIIYTEPLLSEEMKDTFLIYGFPESTLVPDIYFDENLGPAFTCLMHGNLKKGIILNEKVPWWDMYNVYMVSPEVQRLLTNKFISSKQFHHSSLLLKSHKKLNVAESPEHMELVYLHNRMIIAVYKKDQLQLIQNLIFDNIADILYYLLDICRQFELNPQQLNFKISGFILKDSPVYVELAKYFPKISFDEISNGIPINDELRQYPFHYFSSFLKLAACV